MKIIKQTIRSYTVEEGNKFVGWIEKQKEGFYKVSIKTPADVDIEYVKTFKEAKEKAAQLVAYWKD